MIYFKQFVLFLKKKHKTYSLTMKLSFIICMLCMVHLSASVYSQNTLFSLELKDQTVKAILDKIENNSEFRFFYNDNFVDMNRVTSVGVKDKNITDILNQLFYDTPITYQVLENNLIVITPRGITLQGIAVSGTITDNNGESMPGVNVIVKGTTTGVVTDGSGKYSITVPSESAVLVFSFIGFSSQEITVGSRRNIDVSLAEDTREIEEVVVVGYGTQRKSDVTGSVSIVDSKDLLRTPSFSAISGLKGIASGVNVFVNSGRPGGKQTVVIRGQSSIKSVTGPLYVVDGVVMEDFQFVNPNDIERMEVLKDASAAAIYGARGAQGVILVTTKRGNKGDGTIVSYSGYVSVNALGRKMEVLDANDYMKAYRISMQNAVKYGGKTVAEMDSKWTDIAQNSSLNPDYYDLFRINGTFNPRGWQDLNDNTLEPIYNTDWQEESTRNSVSQSHQLNIQQGGKNSSVGAFLNYTDTEGLMLNTYMKRINARIAYDADALKWLSTGVNLMVNHTWGNETEEGGGGLEAVRSLIEMPTIFPVKYPDGNWSNTTNKINGFGFEASSNPVHFLSVRDRMVYRTQVFGNASLTFHLAEGLDLKTQFGADGQKRTWRRYYPYGVVNMDNGGKGQAQMEYQDVLYWQEETYLTYKKVFDQHRFNGMLGLSWQERTYRKSTNDVGNFPTNAFGFENLGAGSEQNAQSSEYQRWAMNSYFGRLAYTYADKYMATLTARMDGSSKFGANNKYAFFPSAGLGWMISNESFMQDVSWIDQLKLHTSYGMTGNSEIDPYRSLSVYSTTTVLLNSVRASSAYPDRLANPDLRWEKTNQFDVGFNLNMFGNRLNFDASYYYKYTDDLLLDAPIPGSSGFDTYVKNVGAVSNQGLDAMVTGTMISTGDFEWTATVNANYNKNRVEKLNENNADVFVGDNWVGAQVIMRVGEPLACFYGLERLGIKSPEYVAQNGGRVGSALRSKDKKIIGKGMPDWTGSFMTNFRYKNFDLSVDLQFVIGGNIRQDFYHSSEDRFALTSGLKTILTDAWTEGMPTDQPNMVQAIRNGSFDGQDSNFDTRWLAKASYLRGNNFQLGYNFTPQQTSFLHLSALRAYVSVSNLFVVTAKDFQGFDPEGSTRGVFEQNVFFFQYPRPTVYTFGINLTF